MTRAERTMFDGLLAGIEYDLLLDYLDWGLGTEFAVLVDAS